jgi:hypothetical protein
MCSILYLEQGCPTYNDVGAETQYLVQVAGHTNVNTKFCILRLFEESTDRHTFKSNLA